jgi:hypothetical protein
VTGPDGGLVTGGFINFDEHRNPVVFVEELFFNPVTQQPFLVSTSPVQIGIASIQPGLVVEFVKAETPRAIKAYGRLTPHNAGNDLAYDKEFVRKAVQFVIDNVTGKDKLLLHGPIDVDVVRRDCLGTLKAQLLCARLPRSKAPVGHEVTHPHHKIAETKKTRAPHVRTGM